MACHPLQPGAGNLPDLSGRRKPSVRRKRHLDLASHPGRLISGSFDLWLPGGNAIGPQTRFFSPTADTTLTIPSTARSAITVGAYDPRLSSYASFSGRGYTRILHEIKPDLAAPGVNIPAPPFRRRLCFLHRHLVCHAFCIGKRRAYDGMGYSARK